MDVFTDHARSRFSPTVEENWALQGVHHSNNFADYKPSGWPSSLCFVMRIYNMRPHDSTRVL